MLIIFFLLPKTLFSINSSVRFWLSTMMFLEFCKHMKFYLGVTNNQWFQYLSGINPEDVNFWQPGGNSNFRALAPGAPFLFKLKAPMNAIGGIGFFSSHTFLPLSVAWDAFQDRNGCEGFLEFRDMILAHRNDKGNTNPKIGCIVLTNPLFFKPSDWIETPRDWAKSIVQGKSYQTEEPAGKEIWTKVQRLLDDYLHAGTQDDQNNWIYDPQPAGYRNAVLTKVRLGQGAFRVLVTDAYTRRCSITGEKTLPVLEAAHIKPFAASGPHLVSNGLLLRSDIHKLFDSGYITITPNMKVEVSRRIREEFQNGREYYQYHGKDLPLLPGRVADRPDPGFIDWHNTHVYRG